jgi:hypothetical protein
LLRFVSPLYVKRELGNAGFQLRHIENYGSVTKEEGRTHLG